MKVYFLLISVVTLMCAFQTEGQPLGPGQVRLEKLREFKQNHLEDVSPDGKLALFYQTSVPMRTFTFPLNGGRPNANQPPVYDDILRVVKIENGQEISRIPTNFFPYYAAFFGSNDDVYYSEHDALFKGVVDKIWSPLNGKVRICIERNKIGLGENEILGDFSLISREKAVATIVQRQSSPILVSVPLTQKGEINKIGQLGPNDPRDEFAGQIRSMAVSPDRKQVAFRTRGNVLVFRTAADLSLGRNVAAPSDLMFENVIYTPDGKYLVVFADSRTPKESSDKNYLLFFDTKTFQVVRTLDITSWDPSLLKDSNSEYVLVRSGAMAISPDSKIIAVGQTRTVRKIFSTTEQAEIVLYDLASGREVTRVNHPAVKEDRNNPFIAKVGKILFTPNGKYLLSSARDTYLWEVKY